MNRIYFTICCLIVSVSLSAQEVDSLRLDSLTSFLTLQTNDAEMVKVYNTLAEDYLRISDHETAKDYASLAKDLSRKISDEKGELEALCNLAHIHSAFKLEYQQSIEYLDQAYELAKKLDLKDYEVRVYRGYAATYAALNDFETAINYNQRAISLATAMGNDYVVSDLSAYAGNIYEAMGDTLKALEMYKEVVDIETSTNFENSSKAGLVTVAYYYYLNDEPKKALKQYQRALVIFEEQKDMRWVSYTHSEMSKIFLETEDYYLAEKHGLMGLMISEELRLEKEISDNYTALIKVYEAQGEDEMAANYQAKYDSVMNQTQVEVFSTVNDDLKLSEKSDDSPNSIWNSVFQAIIILGLVVLSVLLYGFASRKK